MRKKKWIIFIIIGILIFTFRTQTLQVLNNFFSNLGKPINASVYTLIVTLISVALAYYFAIRHDNYKYERERFQTLYMPLLNKITAYYDVKTHWRRGHDICDSVSEGDIEQYILKHVSDNIRYASSKLISEFMSIDRYNYIEDFKGDMFQIEFLLFNSIILDDVLRLNHKCKIFNSSLEKYINYYYRMYVVYSIIAKATNDEQKSTLFISWQWQFKKISKLKYYIIIFINRILIIFHMKTKVIDFIIFLVSKNEEDKKTYLKILN